MKIFELYLGGHYFQGWDSGLLVTLESLEKINECVTFREKYLTDYGSHKVTYLGQDENYPNRWYGTIVWKDTSGVFWTMEFSLKEKETFL